MLHQQSQRAQAVAHQGDHRLCVHLGVGAPSPRPQPKAPSPLAASCLQVAPTQPELGASKAAWELCAPHQVSSQTALRPPHSWLPAYWRAHLLRYSNKTIFDHGNPNYNMPNQVSGAVKRGGATAHLSLYCVLAPPAWLIIAVLYWRCYCSGLARGNWQWIKILVNKLTGSPKSSCISLKRGYASWQICNIRFTGT